MVLGKNVFVNKAQVFIYFSPGLMWNPFMCEQFSMTFEETQFSEKG